MDRTAFRSELSALINRHSLENGSNTPDYMLAAYLDGCLDVFDNIVTAREKWHGRGPQPVPATDK